MRAVVTVAALLLLCQQASPVREARDLTPLRITGRVVAVSDVATVPDVPLGRAVVVAFPRDAFPAVLGKSESLAAPTGELAFTAFRLAATEHQQYAAATAVTDDRGRYELALPPGAYLLCVANVTTRKAEQPPFEVAGCVRAAGESAQEVRRDIGFGEGGVTALPDRSP